MNHPGLLLIGHGSPRPAGNVQFLAFAERLSRAAAGSMLVEPCFLSHAEPGVEVGVERLLARGARPVAVVPLMFFAAAHVKIDIPRYIAAARRRYPDSPFYVARPLGVHAALIEIAAEEVALAEASAGRSYDRGETIVLLVGRGSSDPEANADLVRMADLLRARLGCAAVEPGYCDVVHPTVQESLARALHFGARRVVLLPCFLFRGVLMDRMQEMLYQWREAHPRIEFLFAGAEGMGRHPALTALCLERASEALQANQANQGGNTPTYVLFSCPIEKGGQR